MSKPVVFNWPLLSLDAVCLLQNTAGAGNLVINGALSTFGGPFASAVVFNGIIRTISITSTNNLSADNFTVTGTDYKGAPLTQTILGPNNTTVQTTATFATVTSVSVNAAVNGVEVGTGTNGQTFWNKYDYYRAYSSLGIQVVVAGTINWTFFITSDDVNSPNGVSAFAPDTNLDNETTSKIDYIINPTNYYTLAINSSDATGALVATFIQQG